MADALVLCNQAAQLRSEIDALTEKLEAVTALEKKIRAQGYTQYHEYAGQLEGAELKLYDYATTLSKKGGNYVKSIELFEKLLLHSATSDGAAFFLAGIYLKGKTDDSRKDYVDRKQNLSDVPTADFYAGMIKCPDLKKKWENKKSKYLPILY